MELAASIESLRTFVPAKDFAVSKRFYTDLGFAIRDIDSKLAHVHIAEFAFLLQDYYVADWANNFMMAMMVRDLDAWWRHIDGLQLATRYGVRPPSAPKVQPWGLREVNVIDPAGVLWHFTQRLS
jgi:uncharacterized glyoxalase superfamily protein PhnB